METPYPAEALRSPSSFLSHRAERVLKLRSSESALQTAINDSNEAFEAAVQEIRKALPPRVSQARNSYHPR